MPREVTSKQSGVHEDLVKLVNRHRMHDFKRPIAEHTKQAFTRFLEWLSDWQGELLVDACCGVGESTMRLAQQFPHSRVVGIDKSIARLEKHHSYQEKNGNSARASVNDANYQLFQADLNDFWRLLAQYLQHNKPAWTISKQCIFYPNPYPKKSQLGKRWHASALLPSILAVSENLELRSNWLIYLHEFLVAVQQYGLSGEISEIKPEDLKASGIQAITPFERKYLDANQTCFKLVIRPSGNDKK